MADKKALLATLAIDEHEREAAAGTRPYVVAGLLLLVGLVAVWLWLKPAAQALAVETTAAAAAAGVASSGANTVLNASGFVTARLQATVSSKITGKVTGVFIEEGDVVEEGQLLATLDDSIPAANLELSRTQLRASLARLSEVEVQIQEAQLDFRRITELAQKDLASTADLDRARLGLQALQARLQAQVAETEVARSSVAVQEQQLGDTRILAPFSGVVILKAAQPGEMISPVTAGGGFTATGICTIVDMASLEIEVDVSESYINRVSPGQPVTATLNSYQDWQIPARVIAIIPTADRNKATVRVRVAFLQRDPRILPEMGVKVAFLEGAAEAPAEPRSVSGVLIPDHAVAAHAGGNRVFVVSDGRISPREVRLGGRLNGRRNVISGLDSGEIVVTGLDDDLIAQLEEGRRVALAE